MVNRRWSDNGAVRGTAWAERIAHIALKCSPIFIFGQDAHLKYLWADGHAFGESTSSLVGKCDADILERQQDCELLTSIKQWVLTHTGNRREVVAVQVGGMMRYYDLTVEAVVEHGRSIGVAGALVDITEHKLLEKRLALKARMLSKVNDAVIATDNDGIITFFNAAAEKMYNTRAEDAIGKSLKSVCDYCWLKTEEQLEVEASLVTTGSWKGERQHTRKDGTQINVECSVTVLTDDDGIQTGYLGIIHDITERKLAEEQKLDFYRQTISAATQGRFVILEPSEIDDIVGPAHYEWRVDNMESIAIARHAASQFAAEKGLRQCAIERLEVCIGELASNACKYASGGRCSVHWTGEELFFKVCDDGPGIEALRLPRVALLRRYTTGKSAGLGYKLVIESADAVYLSTGPTGTTVAVKILDQRNGLLDLYEPTI